MYVKIHVFDQCNSIDFLKIVLMKIPCKWESCLVRDLDQMLLLQILHSGFEDWEVAMIS